VKKMKVILLKLIGNKDAIEALKWRLVNAGCQLHSQGRLIPNQGDDGFHQFVNVTIPEQEAAHVYP
jgi:hypothetical protein